MRTDITDESGQFWPHSFSGTLAWTLGPHYPTIQFLSMRDKLSHLDYIFFFEGILDYILKVIILNGLIIA